MTELAASHETGALQPDGTIKPEGTMNVQHVARLCRDVVNKV